jgi:hypothetical protein
LFDGHPGVIANFIPCSIEELLSGLVSQADVSVFFFSARFSKHLGQ